MNKMWSVHTTAYYSALIKEGQGFSGGPGVKNLPVQRATGKLTLPYVKQIASGNLLYDSGNSNWVSVTTYRGGMGWEVGGRFKRDGTYVSL